MFELVFVACMVGAPGACEERSLVYVGRPNPFACMVVAPQYLAVWIDEHPAYRIASWRCRDPESREFAPEPMRLQRCATATGLCCVAALQVQH